MAATGYTPIYLYYSGTSTHVPLVTDLGNGELAINAADGKLFYKNTSNALVTIPLLQSSGSQNGWLSSTDWTTFNNKQPAGSYALTTGTLAQFASTTSAQLAGVISDETGLGALVFGTSPTIATPTLTGNVNCSTGNVVIGTSGKGIDFSATAGTGTSELLDDYEEGTWTPYFGCDTTNPTITYTVQSGLYRKIGKIVYIECGLVINTTSGGSGALRVYGLPYTHSNNSTSAGLSNAFVFGFTNALNEYVIGANLNSILVYRSTSTNTLANATDLVNGAYFFISGSYTV